MSMPTPPPQGDVATPAPRVTQRGKRRARKRRTHTVAKVLGATLVVMALVTGLSITYFYRHFSGNLTVLDIDDQLVGDRPDKVQTVAEGEREPLNVLIMGSDTREGANNIDGLTGDGQRSDTTLLLHFSADRERAYGISIPRDSMVNRPQCRTDDGTTTPAATYQMWNVAFQVAGPACTMKIRRLTLQPPYAPATTTHARKNRANSREPVTTPYSRPAARKPLYSPWLAASTREASAFSGVCRNTFSPSGRVHRNISSTRKYRCSSATSTTSTIATRDMRTPCSARRGAQG